MEYDDNRKRSVLIVASNLNLIEHLSFSLRVWADEVNVLPYLDENLEAQMQNQSWAVVLLDLSDTSLTQQIFSDAQLFRQLDNIPWIGIYKGDVNHELLQYVKKVAPPIYLINAMNREGLLVTIELAMKRKLNEQKMYARQQKSSLWVKINTSFYKIKYQDIAYIKHGQHGINIYTQLGKTYEIAMDIDDLVALLPAHFLRTHQHYIVNIKNVSCIYPQTIVINQIDVPLSKVYYARVMRYIQ